MASDFYRIFIQNIVVVDIVKQINRICLLYGGHCNIYGWMEIEIFQCYQEQI